jgi:hypothetical protein
MSRQLFVRGWQRLCQRADRIWRRNAEVEELIRTVRKSELVERGARYGVDVLREIRSRMPTVEATLATTVEETLSTLVDGSEDWDVIEEWVDGIVVAELRGGARGWTPQGAGS